MVEPSTKPEQIVVDWRSLWNEPDPSQASEFLSDGVVLIDPGIIGWDDIPGPDGEAHGIDAVSSVMDQLLDNWIEWTVEIETVASEGSEVLVESTIRGTFRATERDAEFPCMEKYTVEGSEITYCQWVFDRLDVAEQLGLS